MVSFHLIYRPQTFLHGNMNINDIKGVQISLKEFRFVVEIDGREEESREM